ncbi:MAG: polyamine ABC transporter ATP-binding protein [Rhizobiaceae bacterium]|nr:polyamine ABC transporter ATP-binding protein [Rhizobiaceae bacterium]
MNVKSSQQRRAYQPWEDAEAVPFIEFRNVTKRYGAVTAVDNLSLSIYEREFFALLGPSGCGKTTLMRMLAGFEEITEGAVYLAGEDLSSTPPYRRPVNMMFQSYALFPHMNVEKNIAFGLKQEGMPKAEIADRVAEMLSLVKMQDFASRKPDQLSGGQRQRVALARSLAKQPKLLLLDEPLGALDRKLREETQFELVDLQESLGITFMIVTHDQEEAMTVADRIAVMEHGKIVQVDPPVHMYERPNNRYVADFLGNINLVEATIDKISKDVVTLATPTGNVLTVNHAGGGSPEDKVWVAARPEKLSIGLQKPKQVNCLPGEVWDIAYLGDLTIYKVKLDSGEFVKVSVLNQTVSETRDITWEDQVWLSFEPEAAMILAS